MTTYKTIREAAVAALRVAVPLTEQSLFEYGGLIVKQGNGFTFTEPFTSSSNAYLDLGAAFSRILGTDVGRISSEAMRRLLRKAGVVSSYHAHPDRDPENADYGRLGLAKYSSLGDMRGMYTAGFAKTYLGVAGSREIREVTRDLPTIYPTLEGGPAALGPIIAHV